MTFKLKLRWVNVKKKDYKSCVEQGDNLAHILLIIAMQYMYKLMEKDEKMKDFKNSIFS